MRNKNLSKQSKILIASLCLLVVAGLAYYQSRQPEVVVHLPSQKPVTLDRNESIRSAKNITALSKALQDSEKKKKNRKSAAERHKESLGFNEARYNYFVKQKLLVKNFKEKTHLDIDLPKNMHYVPLDLDDNVAGIYGSNTDKQFAMLATPGKVKMSDVISYIEESKKALPMLEGRELLTDKIQTVPAPESTGLSGLKVIPTTDASGKTAYAAVGERKDGKGTYLFMMEGPTGYFDENEGGLEVMLNSIKTRP
jgi:hypothetical protein